MEKKKNLYFEALGIGAREKNVEKIHLGFFFCFLPFRRKPVKVYVSVTSVSKFINS